MAAAVIAPHRATTAEKPLKAVGGARLAALQVQAVQSDSEDEDYVPPPSARHPDAHAHRQQHQHVHQHHPHHPHSARGHSAELSGGAGAGAGLNGRRRGIQGSMGVNGGRVHKASGASEHSGYPQQHRHHYHRAQAGGEEEGDGLGPLPHGGGRLGGVGRSLSASADLQHPAGGSGRYAAAGYHRTFSGPACTGSASLGSVLAATKLFGPILGALGGALGMGGAAPPLPAGGVGCAHTAAAAAHAAAQQQASPSKRHLFGGSSGANGYANGYSQRPK